MVTDDGARMDREIEKLREWRHFADKTLDAQVKWRTEYVEPLLAELQAAVSAMQEQDKIAAAVAAAVSADRHHWFKVLAMPVKVLLVGASVLVAGAVVTNSIVQLVRYVGG